MKILNLQEHGIHFSIDPKRLDEEWRGQAQMVYNAGAEAAKLEKEYNEAKDGFEFVSATLSNDIRQQPNLYGIEKITEKAIDEAKILQPEYRAAKRKLADAQLKMDLAFVTSKSLEHRKKALEKMVDLYLREYHSEPAPRGNSADAQEFGRDSVRSRMRENARDKDIIS